MIIAYEPKQVQVHGRVSWPVGPFEVQEQQQRWGCSKRGSCTTGGRYSCGAQEGHEDPKRQKRPSPAKESLGSGVLQKAPDYPNVAVASCHTCVQTCTSTREQIAGNFECHEHSVGATLGEGGLA